MYGDVMRSEITDKVTKVDYDRISSMVRHRLKMTPNLHPDVIESEDGYTVNGISHLSLDTINKVEYLVCVKIIKELLSDKKPSGSKIKKVKIDKITKLCNNNDEVYDISMAGENHNFFGNGILLHNTDSVMFSAKKAWDDANKGLIQDKKMDSFVKSAYKNMTWDKDSVLSLYQGVASIVDQSFPGFMNDTFNTGMENGKIIAAGLEIVGTRGIFLKKKRYTILLYYKDGFRLDKFDKEGNLIKAGKLKNMGTELKRSDTPKLIQDFLEETMMKLLTEADIGEIKKYVLDFKRKFADMKPWERGMPKTIKGMTKYENQINETGKCSVGHAVASINWNRLCEINQDSTSPRISDGTKIVVCELLSNAYNMKKVAFPADLEHLPEWFKNLPFDEGLMNMSVVNKKLDNVFGILGLDLGIHDDVMVQDDQDDIFF